MLHEQVTLFTDRIRHDDHRLIAANRSDQRKANALITTGRLDNNGVLVNPTGFFSGLNHI